MKKIWDIYPRLTEVVRSAHLEEGMMGGGHDFEHAARVAQYAFIILEDPVCAKLAGAAGLCHNADRVFQVKLGVGRRDVSDEAIMSLVSNWLDYTEFSVVERELIVNAVLNHDSASDESDHPVSIALRDADKLVNIEADLIIRCGQFQPYLPAVDFVHFISDPEANYRNPKSVLRDISHSLEWEDSPKFYLQLPKAQEMGKTRFAFLKLFIQTLESQLKESGLVPYPFC